MNEENLPFGTPETMEQVRELADTLRTLYDHTDKILDVELLLERDLEITLLPVPSLLEETGVEAVLCWDLKNIMVDKARLDDRKFCNRFRFSLAHEIGHAVMHRNLVHLIKPESIDDFILNGDRLNSMFYAMLEAQANEFAGRLLVSKEHLANEIEFRKPYIQAAVRMASGSRKMLVDVLAAGLADNFKVSIEVMAIRLRTEDVLFPYLSSTNPE
ncbi:MAG: ImmA/IrrE family metallo-endopeptidase [Bacteroidetes bacterium]|nr:ImmA/IrrE family metallo-endopeptidase [Bacteroidota bacterium]